MSNTLSGARLSDEAAFFKRYLSGLGSHTQTYDDDYVCPPEKRPRRMPVLSVSFFVVHNWGLAVWLLIACTLFASLLCTLLANVS